MYQRAESHPRYERHDGCVRLCHSYQQGRARISLSADQFLVSGKNGMVIDDFSDIGRSLTYYLDSFENWNQALVECYELGQKYTTSVLLKKWRKVLNFSE